MEKPPENLSLLEQHIFQQNQRLIELSGRLKKFCDDANNAIYDAEEKSEEKITTIKWATIGVVICAIFFGGGGYLIGQAVNTISISNAKSDLKEANERASAAVDASKIAAADFEKRLSDEVRKISEAGGWATTAQGRLAKRFFDSGWGVKVATCKDANWNIEKVKKENGEIATLCILKPASLFGKEPRSGWEIPQ